MVIQRGVCYVACMRSPHLVSWVVKEERCFKLWPSWIAPGTDNIPRAEHAAGQEVTLEGVDAFDAAVHCASLSAGQRALQQQKAQQQQQQHSRADSSSGSSLGSSSDSSTSCSPRSVMSSIRGMFRGPGRN